MDAFLAFCQALGIGIAVGTFAGAPGVEGGARGGMTLLAAAIGLVVGIISASADDQAVILGAIGGLVGAVLACVVISDLSAGARRRGGGGPGALGLILAVAALAIAGLSILLPPIALAPLLGLLWLGSARRRRSQRKYEGLRVLR